MAHHAPTVRIAGPRLSLRHGGDEPELVFSLAQPFSAFVIAEPGGARALVRLGQGRGVARRTVTFLGAVSPSGALPGADVVCAEPGLFQGSRWPWRHGPLLLAPSAEEPRPLDAVLALLERQRDWNAEPFVVPLPYPFRRAALFPDGAEVIVDGGSRAFYPYASEYFVAAKAVPLPPSRLSAFLRRPPRAWLSLALVPEAGTPLIIALPADGALAEVVPERWELSFTGVTEAVERERTLVLERYDWQSLELLLLLAAFNRLAGAEPPLPQPVRESLARGAALAFVG